LLKKWSESREKPDPFPFSLNTEDFFINLLTRPYRIGTLPDMEGRVFRPSRTI